MAQMSTTGGAEHLKCNSKGEWCTKNASNWSENRGFFYLSPSHPKLEISLSCDLVILICIPHTVNKAGPPRSRVKLLLAWKEGSATTDTIIHSWMITVKFPVEVFVIDMVTMIVEFMSSPFSLFSLYLPVQARSVPPPLATWSCYAMWTKNN